MLEAILSGLAGGVLRMLPEVLKWLDRKGERKHELDMFDREIEVAKLRLEGELRKAELVGEAEFAKQAVETLRAAITAQGQAPGVAGVLGGLVRPVITLLFFGVWGCVKLAAFFVALETSDWRFAVTSIWTAEDQALLAGIMNFWFVGRVFEKVVR